MTFGIHLSVKVRAFFMDLYKFDKAVTVQLTPLQVSTWSNPIPSSAKTVMNERGVVLQVWQV